MNGNRGSKGSIKDRLISMLYRLRYKKKVLKEEDYTKEKKEKQESYIYNLEKFKEKENLNILDNTDKNELDKINFNVNFKIDETDKLNLKLDSIEYKNSELEEKVDLKKEVKKTKTEIVILKEVDSFIKKSIENLNDIQNELDSIKKDSKEKNKDTKELEEKYNNLKKKIDKLKKQYEVVSNKYDLSEFSILESIKLMESVTDYKSIAKLNEIEMMVKVCKKEISKIDNITILVEENKKVGINIDNTKVEQDNIKIKFNKSKEKINSINILEDEIKYQQKQVDDMYNKASYLEVNTRKKIEYIGHRNIIGSIFRIVGGIFTLPLSGKKLFGVALGSTLMNIGLKQMNKSLEKKEKIVIDYKYEDVSKQIDSIKDKVGYINLILTDSLNEISKLKSNFQNTYLEYIDILPEYGSTFEKLNLMENKILKQQEKLLNMDKKLNESKDKNKQKLKKIGR